MSQVSSTLRTSLVFFMSQAKMYSPPRKRRPPVSVDSAIVYDFAVLEFSRW
jgi:hypothetical protein